MKKEIEHLVAEIGKKKAEIRNEALKRAMSVKRIRVMNCCWQIYKKLQISKNKKKEILYNISK